MSDLSVSDHQREALVERYEEDEGFTNTDLMVQFFYDEFTDGKKLVSNDDLKAFYTSEGAEGTTLTDLARDYWTRIINA